MFPQVVFADDSRGKLDVAYGNTVPVAQDDNGIAKGDPLVVWGVPL